MTKYGYSVKLYAHIGFCGFTVEDAENIMTWVSYKNARISRQTFDALMESYREHKAQSGWTTELCGQVIHESIARGYKGIAWELGDMILRARRFAEKDRDKSPVVRFSERELDALVIHLTDEEE